MSITTFFLGSAPFVVFLVIFFSAIYIGVNALRAWLACRNPSDCDYQGSVEVDDFVKS